MENSSNFYEKTEKIQTIDAITVGKYSFVIDQSCSPKLSNKIKTFIPKIFPDLENYLSLSGGKTITFKEDPKGIKSRGAISGEITIGASTTLSEPQLEENIIHELYHAVKSNKLYSRFEEGLAMYITKNIAKKHHILAPNYERVKDFISGANVESAIPLPVTIPWSGSKNNSSLDPERYYNAQKMRNDSSPTMEEIKNFHDECDKISSLSKLQSISSEEYLNKIVAAFKQSFSGYPSLLESIKKFCGIQGFEKDGKYLYAMCFYPEEEIYVHSSERNLAKGTPEIAIPNMSFTFAAKSGGKLVTRTFPTQNNGSIRINIASLRGLLGNGSIIITISDPQGKFKTETITIPAKGK